MCGKSRYLTITLPMIVQVCFVALAHSPPPFTRVCLSNHRRPSLRSKSRSVTRLHADIALSISSQQRCDGRAFAQVFAADEAPPDEYFVPGSNAATPSGTQPARVTHAPRTDTHEHDPRPGTTAAAAGAAGGLAREVGVVSERERESGCAAMRGGSDAIGEVYPVRHRVNAPLPPPPLPSGHADDCDVLELDDDDDELALMPLAAKRARV